VLLAGVSALAVLVVRLAADESLLATLLLQFLLVQLSLIINEPQVQNCANLNQLLLYKYITKSEFLVNLFL
jgi:hypothetical protein